MKRLFSKRFSLQPQQLSQKPAATAAPSSSIAHTTGLQPSYVLPPLPHPRPYDHMALLATQAGLLVFPHLPGGAHPEHHVRISWGRLLRVEELNSDEDSQGAAWAESVVTYGIIGILELFNASYLLVITQKSDVGHLLDGSRPIHGIKGVTAIPLDSEQRARTVLSALASRNASAARFSLVAGPSSEVVEPTQDISMEDVDSKSLEDLDEITSPHVKFADEDQVKVMSPLNIQEFALPDGPPSPLSGASTPSSAYSVNTSPIAKTLTERLSFWSRLSKRSSYAPVSAELRATPEEERESLDHIIDGGEQEPAEVLNDILETTAPPPTTLDEKHSELEEKILREVVKEYGKGEMYFAYNFDITRSLQNKQDQICKNQKRNSLLADLNALDSSFAIGDKVDVLAEPSPTLPLWRRADRQFWWNEWLSKPFIDAGLHSYVLPIVQGFFQVASFPVPREPETTESGDAAIVDYIILSRRSKNRAGLRYQRRGIDDDAHVANFVETETIMRVEREGVSNIFSYVQIRGSIPLFWTQSGYSLKPAPTLSPERTREQNIDALSRHFKRTLPPYGPHTVVNLAEHHGKEGVVTQAYRDYLSEANLSGVQYHEYDFHAETKGMKYENISKLIEHLDRTFEAQGYLWICNETVLSRQKGVYRTNCIDCLDRTNVVQSAFARHMLNRQLLAVALFNPSEQGRTTIDVVFNDMWANNGDAISRSYAGTSALKGDFTRTGKRDLGGLLNDGMNSLARMYTSTFSDWFSQTVIDFMLGYRTLSVFSEFLLKLQSTDPRELIRLSKIRAEAIATSVSRVLQDGERLLSGWTLFAPVELNTTVGDKFEEKVLLLSVKALYIVSYDYNLEKVKMYTRVPLGDVVKITKGAYILSPLEEASRDPIQNAGFTIHYLNTRQTTRVTSYSVRNSVEKTLPPPPPTGLAPTPSPRPVSQLRPLTLSRILSGTAPTPDTGGTSFAAFKALPIDPARTSRGSRFASEPADELAGAATCREAVELMVDTIRAACTDAGAAGAGYEFVKAEDVVSLVEAQKMTSVYAKMEYGVKRLLWLGG